tara:strand:- start:1307 stop:2968 length:1662 start_codon:yes stop_codon:yes gene_type:complete
MDERLKDFRNFLYMVWEHIGLPEPTPCQYDIAQYVQHGPKRRMVQAFRGVGKSFITSAYACHQLLLNPDIKILVVSASKIRADDFSTFVQRLITEMPVLRHLKPRDEQRQSKISFDVGPCQPAHAPSVKSVGITGQLTGSRANLIIADDIESANNSMTQTMRDRLSETVKEFDAVLSPDGDIVYLGTPQTEMSIYNSLTERGYEIKIWPARYPTSAKMLNYGDKLAPKVAELLEKGLKKENDPVDPLRFDEDDLLERQASYGNSGFSLQFMLDTTLSDLERYPLKIPELIVHPIDNDLLPEKLIWCSHPDSAYAELPCVGFNGDRYYRPFAVEGDYIESTGSVMSIDPSGRGQDETGYAVVKMLNGQLFVPECGGIQGGYSTESLERLVRIAKKNKVNLILIESNFGDGMFMELLKPHLIKKYPVKVEEIRSSIQKERRIIDTLEPVINQHKLIFDPKVIQHDYDSAQKYTADKQLKYMLFYQLSRITRDKGSLTHDDRLDALSMAVGYWVEQMNQDADQSIKDRKSSLLDKELNRFLDHCVGVRNIESPTWI